VSRLGDLFRDARKRHKIRRERPQFWDFPAYGFGYIQIPKVATRSILRSLGRLPVRETGENFDDFESRHSAHVDHGMIRRRVDEGLFVFAFVRDPLERLYSAWNNKVNRPEDSRNRNIFSCHGMYDRMPFDAFVRRVCELEDREIDRHLRSQCWFLCDEQGLIPSWVERLERFADDWQALQQTFPALPPVPHLNSTAATRIDHRDALDPELARMVVERYRRDYEVFAYPPPV